MAGQYYQYVFKGDVFKFEHKIARNYECQTYAISDNKALANIKHQFKKYYDLSRDTPLKLYGELFKIKNGKAEKIKL